MDTYPRPIDTAAYCEIGGVVNVTITKDCGPNYIDCMYMRKHSRICEVNNEPCQYAFKELHEILGL